MRKYILHHYVNGSGKDLIQAYIDKLSIDEQVDAEHVLKNMEEGNFDIL